MTNQEKALKMHEEWNGKLETIAKSHVKTREDLAIAYTRVLLSHAKLSLKIKKPHTNIQSNPTQLLLYLTEVPCLDLAI